MKTEFSHEPLKPDPQWIYTSAGYHSAHGGVSVKSPHDYAAGFENGAFALAELLWPLVASVNREKQEEAFRLLRRYHDGLAHPVRDWQHEPKRN